MALSDPLIISGNVDTIYDGIIGGPVSFQIIDKAIDVPTGTYSLTVVFRTKDVIFDSLKLELLVYNSYLQTCVQHDLKPTDLNPTVVLRLTPSLLKLLH